MIVRITAENFELGSELNKYASHKVQDLTRFLPRSDRATAVVEVVFSELISKKVTLKTCQLQVKFRREDFIARETTQHFYAALDVAAVSVEEQLREHKKCNPARLRSYLRRAGKSR